MKCIASTPAASLIYILWRYKVTGGKSPPTDLTNRKNLTGDINLCESALCKDKSREVDSTVFSYATLQSQSAACWCQLTRFVDMKTQTFQSHQSTFTNFVTFTELTLQNMITTVLESHQFKECSVFVDDAKKLGFKEV